MGERLRGLAQGVGLVDDGCEPPGFDELFHEHQVDTIRHREVPAQALADAKASAYLLISAGSSMRMGLAFGGLVVVGAIAMVIYELFSWIERRATAWAHRGSNRV